MTNSTDDEIRRAFGEAVQAELQEFTLTADMQRRVLSRLRTLEPQPAVAPPRRRLGPILSWSAVAAAVLIALSTRFLVGSGAKSGAGSASQTDVATSKASSASGQAGPRAESPLDAGLQMAGGPTSTPNATAEDGKKPSPRSQQVDPQATAFASTAKVTVKPAWDRPVDGLTQQSRLSVSTDGQVAVSAGTKVAIMKPNGAVAMTLPTAQPVTATAWSADGRLAVVAGTDAVVYQGLQEQFRLSVGQGADLSFGPSGLLAVVGGLDGDRRITLIDRQGAVVAQVSAPTAVGKGVAILNGGSHVMAGAQVYSRGGDLLWKAPLEPRGTLVLGDGAQLIVWDNHTIIGLRPEDGQVSWSIHPEGGGEGLTSGSGSSDGKLAALLLRSESGPHVLVVDANGGVRYRTQLSASPYDAAISGNTLLLLMPNSVRALDLEGLR